MLVADLRLKFESADIGQSDIQYQATRKSRSGKSEIFRNSAKDRGRQKLCRQKLAKGFAYPKIVINDQYQAVAACHVGPIR